MLNAEFHLHTEWSPDSRMSLRTVRRACELRHIDCVFVTDHNQIRGGQELREQAPFRVIVSEEITTSEGEMIGYFLTDRIPPLLSPEETIARIRAQGGVVSVPHPFDRLRHARMPLRALNRIIEQVDMLEVWNARNVFSEDDRSARIYATAQHKRAVVASDAHTHWEVGRSYITLEDFSDAEGLLRSLDSATLHTERSPLFVHASTKWNKYRTRLFGHPHHAQLV